MEEVLQHLLLLLLLGLPPLLPCRFAACNAACIFTACHRAEEKVGASKITHLLDFSPCSVPGQLEDTLDGVDGQNNWLGVQPGPRHVNLRNICLAIFSNIALVHCYLS